MYSYRTLHWPQSASQLVRFRKPAKQPPKLPISDMPTAVPDRSSETDTQIVRKVKSELRREPSVPTAHVTPTDDEIVHDCEQVLGDLTPASDYVIDVMVTNGWVTLSGYVAEGYERSIVETEISSLPSVHGVSCQVRVRPLRVTNSSGADNAASRHARTELKSGSYEFVRSYDGMTWSEMRTAWAAHRAQLHAAWSASGAKRVTGRIRPS